MNHFTQARDAVLLVIGSNGVAYFTVVLLLRNLKACEHGTLLKSSRAPIFWISSYYSVMCMRMCATILFHSMESKSAWLSAKESGTFVHAC